MKAEFVRRLVSAGLSSVELTSFVSPKWVQLADADQLLVLLGLLAGRHPVLVPNERGLVLQGRHAGSVFGVVTHQATECHDAAAVRKTCPLPRLVNRQCLVGHANPVADPWRGDGRMGHEVTLWIGPVSSRSERTSALARRAMISAQIATAVSSGVRAPIARPIGAMISFS